jgi:N-acyl-L-homoserine lactone synthetase
MEAKIHERGDAVAASLLAWLAPLRFTEAEDEGEREACYRLRHRAVLDAGMEAPTALSRGRERDEFDADAVQVLGWDGTRPVATCRLVFPSPLRGLPLESTFGEIAPDASQTVEWGRVSVDPQLRGEGGRILMGLAARGWLSMRSRGLSTAIGVTTGRLVALLRALGFPIVVIGPSRPHWGIERVPILCEGRVAVATLERLWSTRDEPPRVPDGSPGGSPGGAEA